MLVLNEWHIHTCVCVQIHFENTNYLLWPHYMIIKKMAMPRGFFCMNFPTDNLCYIRQVLSLVQVGVCQVWIVYVTSFYFYLLLTVHHAMILGNCPTWCTNSFQCIYLFIVLYMFRASYAHHQEKQIISIQLLVIVTL